MEQKKEKNDKNHKNTVLKKAVVFVIAILIILGMVFGKRFVTRGYAKETEQVTDTKESIEIKDRDDMKAVLEKLDAMEKSIEEDKKASEKSGNEDVVKRLSSLEKNISVTKTEILNAISQIDTGEKTDISRLYKKIDEDYKSISKEYETNILNKIDSYSTTVNQQMKTNQTECENKITALESEITELKSSLQTVSEKVNSVDTYYPVGSLYCSFSGESPANLFGGTWEKIEEGRTLISSGDTYALNSTGGAAEYTLTKDNLPNTEFTVFDPGHNHTFMLNYGASLAGTGASTSGPETIAGPYGTKSATTGIKVYSGGQDAPFSLMQPYYVVNIWKRVA